MQQGEHEATTANINTKTPTQSESGSPLLYSRDTPAEFEDDRRRELTFKERLLFGVAAAGGGWVIAVVGFFLNPFLLEVALVPPAINGTILLIGRVWDAITDPVIGALTDRTRTRWGRRRPWLLFSALPFAAAYCALFQVPNLETTTAKFLYYLVTYCILETTMTCFLIPYATLLLELSNDVHQRNKLVQYRMMFATLFTLIGAVVQGSIEDYYVADKIKGYQIGGYVGGSVILVSIIITFLGVRERPSHLLGKQERAGFFKGIFEILKLKSYMALTMMYLCAWMSVTVVQNNILLYVQYSVNLSEYDTMLLGILLLSTFAFLFLWTETMRRYGKKTTYLIGMSSYLIVFVSLYFMPRDNLVALIVVSAIGGSGTAIGFLVPQCMLPDVVDEDTIKTGLVREGLFFSFFVFFEKCAVGLALAASNYALAVAGYQNPCPGCDNVVQPDSVDLTLRLLVGPFPACLVALSFLFLWLYPLSTKQVDENIETLAKERVLETERRASLQLPADYGTADVSG